MRIIKSNTRFDIKTEISIIGLLKLNKKIKSKYTKHVDSLENSQLSLLSTH